MPRRISTVLLVLAGAATAIAIAVSSLTVGTPWSWARSQEVPAAAAGQPVPAITRDPVARLAVAGDTGTDRKSVV